MSLVMINEQIFNDNTNNVLAIARWEDNHKKWLQGDYFGLASKSNYLHKILPRGGTLWIVVSRSYQGKRVYSIMFKLQDCQLKTLAHSSKFGKYVVVGEPIKSVYFANNNSKLLLMSLRFNPLLPIKCIDKIGQSIQRPRRLNSDDVKLINDQMCQVERWGVFISYKREKQDSKIANKLYRDLESNDINLFQDTKSIVAGKFWKEILLNSIKKSRCLILIIGENTHQSKWVIKEIEYAQNNKVPIVSVIIGGDLNNFPERLNLSQLQAIKYKNAQWNKVIVDVLQSLTIMNV